MMENHFLLLKPTMRWLLSWYVYHSTGREDTPNKFRLIKIALPDEPICSELFESTETPYPWEKMIFFFCHDDLYIERKEIQCTLASALKR